MSKTSEWSAAKRKLRASLVLALIYPLAVSVGLIGCRSLNSTQSSAPSALDENNINLIFVSSPDLDYHAPGDIQPDKANLTPQGLNRSLLMATYLKQQVLGAKNVTQIIALAPMTHLQTANAYPDMTAIGYIQPFALLNQETLLIDKSPTGPTFTANSQALKVAYPSSASLPGGVAAPQFGYSTTCSGLDYYNNGGCNDALVSRIIDKNRAGYHVFSAPWKTIRDLLATANTRYRYNLNLPSEYLGPNYIYAISIAPSGSVSLVTYDSHLSPLTTYPLLPAPVPRAACTHLLQAQFSAKRIGGVDGVTVPATINKNQTLYIVRHAEAHPDTTFQFENGNFVAAGLWRALDLTNALAGKIKPQVVYSIDPSQWYTAPLSGEDVSYVRASLTVLPYAIDHNLPYHLVSGFSLFGDGVGPLTSNYFFTGGKFSDRTVLLAWESQRVLPLIKALLDSYGGSNLPPLPARWLGDDYNTIWTVRLDAQGNLTVDNDLCEGIDSARLPATAPPF